MTLNEQLAILTDAEAELCLHGLLKGLTVLDAKYQRLLGTPNDIAAVIEQAAAQNGISISKAIELTPGQRPKAVRMLLADIAADPQLSPRLEAWFKTSRPTLLEPVTSSLVLAGIVLVLSTHIKIEYEGAGSKKKLKIKVEKKPTAGKLLAKFAGFFK
jgi:hypothetical protein